MDYRVLISITVPFLLQAGEFLPRVVGYLLHLVHVCCDDSHLSLLLLYLPISSCYHSGHLPQARSGTGRLIWEGRQ
jgi:hypothetical protein